jgi:hypothetical protein
MKGFKKGVLFALMFYCSHAYSAAVTGYVTKINLHSDSWSTYNVSDKAMMSIYVEGLPPGCNKVGGDSRVVITTDHPLYNSVYSLVLSAKVSGKKIRVEYLSTCTHRADGWDFGYISLVE